MADKGSRTDDTKRFAEILGILRRSGLTQGLTPEKVRAIFEALGPTFVKFGQILSMRSDILPKEYCAALEGLRTDVAPMPAELVQRILSRAYGRPWDEVFSSIEPVPLGSASIAQVHAATLCDGRRVVVKVQRPDLYSTMERDVRLLKHGAALLRYTPIANALDLCAVLDEMWRTVQEELDFTIEARNIAEFREDNRGVAYADCPTVCSELSTRSVLVMAFVGGHQIDDLDGLLADGYDLDEIATKLVYNYIRQITEYHFFHADPHPGNIRVEDGRIVWLDLGMMGRLSPREARLYTELIRTINDDDVPGLTDVLLAFGECDRPPDRLQVSTGVETLLNKYKAMSMADMDLGVIVEDFLQLLNRNGVRVPPSLTMLGRSLIVIQGMLSGLSPERSVLEIVAHYAAQNFSGRDFLEAQARELGHQLLRSGSKLTLLPAQLSDTLKLAASGQLVVNWKKAHSDSEAAEKRLLLNRLLLGLADCSLLLCAALLALADIKPRLLGLPWPSAVCFGLAAGISVRLLAAGRRQK